MKGSLFIPIQPIGEHAEQNTIQATANLFIRQVLKWIKNTNNF